MEVGALGVPGQSVIRRVVGVVHSVFEPVLTPLRKMVAALAEGLVTRWRCVVHNLAVRGIAME